MIIYQADGSVSDTIVIKVGTGVVSALMKRNHLSKIMNLNVAFSSV